MLYKQSARQWYERYIYQQPISAYDLRILINVAYLSYQRSATTIRAQDLALHALQTTWKSWQNITHIRRNPSKPLPYILSKKEKNAVKQFFELQEKHSYHSIVYDIASSMLAANEITLEEPANAALKELKSQAKKISAAALTDIKQRTGDLLEYLTIIPGKKSFFDTISTQAMAHIPALLASSFATADQAHIHCSQNGFKSLMCLQEAGNYVWNILETARSQWYFEIYSLLYDHLENYDPTTRVIMFTELGYVNRIANALPLPSPSQLLDN
jgi:hypothetical protein